MQTLTNCLVSIGLPVYNGGEFIGEAIESLLSQTYTEFELIISDNASTDETQKICSRYAAKDKRIKYVRQISNIGPNNNFFYLLEQARGVYFCWAACDDLRSNDWLECLVCSFEDSDVVIQSLVMIDRNFTSADNCKKFSLPYIRRNDSLTAFMQDERQWRSLYIYGLFNRRKLVLANLRSVQNDFWAAEAMLFKLVKYGEMRTVPSTWFYYRDNPSSQGKAEARKYASAFRKLIWPVRFNYITEIYQSSSFPFKIALFVLVPIKQIKVVLESIFRVARKWRA